jgi:hypothetical protein
VPIETKQSSLIILQIDPLMVTTAAGNLDLYLSIMFGNQEFLKDGKNE